MADDCKNPLSTQCTRCYRKGHSSADCRLNPDRDAQIRLAFAARDAHQRYVWRSPDIKLHRSQKAKADYEEAKRNAALSGIPISAEDDIQYQKNIYLASQVFGTNPFIESAKQLGAPVHLNMDSHYTQPAAQIRNNNSNSNAQAAAPNNVAAAKDGRLAKQRALLDNMRRQGHRQQDIKEIENFMHAKNQEDKTEMEKAIATKIAASYCYRLALVNDMIRKLEGEICTKAQLPQSRMDQVKNLMREGSSFFRDPRAMQALFERQTPRCNTCYKDGFITDRWFNVVEPTTKKKDLLALFDVSDWGLFVVFHCKCCREADGYEYLLCGEEYYCQLAEDEK